MVGSIVPGQVDQVIKSSVFGSSFPALEEQKPTNLAKSAACLEAPLSFHPI